MRISDWSSDVCSSDLLPTTHGTAFDGLYQADAFAAFAKLLIYIAAAIAIVIAPRFFVVGGIPRAEYPLLIIFASVGMGMMVSASDLLTLYVGLELNSLHSFFWAASLAKIRARATLGLKYYVWAHWSSSIFFLA